MIYQLPTRSGRGYRGKYPFRIRSWSGRRGVYHAELNSGSRYVLTHDELTISLARPLISPAFVGREFIDVLRYSAVTPPVMSVADYAAIVFLSRLFRHLRAGTCRELMPTALREG